MRWLSSAHFFINRLYKIMIKSLFKPAVVTLFILSLVGCDDGDVVVSNFNFDENTVLNLCGDSGNKILFTIDDQTNEAISFRFAGLDFDGTFDGLNPPEAISINLNNNNKVNYRILNAPANATEYFCQDVPPSSPEVDQEFMSTSGGTAFLSISVTEQNDNDGIPGNQEDLNNNGNLFDDDTDNDGIPNFIDIDDDNDNVLTISEINNDDGDSLPNTDEDGTPNYLDNDDDGDGTLTRNEDLNAFDNLNNNGNPILDPRDDTNADGLANYLNPQIDESIEINQFKQNEISRTFRTQIVIRNVTLEQVNGDQNITFEELILGFYEITSNNEIIPME